MRETAPTVAFSTAVPTLSQSSVRLPDDLTPQQRQQRQQQQDLDQKHAKWNLSGYQADFDFDNKYTGQLYEQSSPRGIIAWRGQVVATEAGKEANSARHSWQF